MTDIKNTDARLIQYIERIERLREERKGISSDINDVYQEVKSAGYEPSIVKDLIRVRAMDAEKRTAQLELFDTYLVAVGMA
jgi:uncharacterized protein (UPF0335 family)